MRRTLFYAFLLAVAGASLISARSPSAQATPHSSWLSASQEQAPQQQTAPSQAPPPQPPQATQTPAPAHIGPVVVLDPAHGGTDSGARGQGAMVEKDLVLSLTRIVRAELERRGFRVVMTRNEDSNPSYDDRAAIANMLRDAVFVSFHVSSTGAIGTVRAYYYQFASPNPAVTGSQASPLNFPQTTGLIAWEEAQRPFADVSHHLADALQSDMGQRFSGSPMSSSGVSVRNLRSVTAPAVAIEISSVSAPDAAALTAMATPIAVSIARSVLALHPATSAGAK